MSYWSTPKYGGGSFGVTHKDRGTLDYFKEERGCKTLLDVGCGLGGQVELAKSIGYKSFGIDVDAQIIKNIQNIALIDLAINPVILPCRCDLVWSVEVAEHIPEQFVDNYIKTLTENCGRFLILTANQTLGGLHVHCKPIEYWINAIESQSELKYSSHETKKVLHKSSMKREFLRETGMVFVRD